MSRFERALEPWWARAIALGLFALALSAFAWWPLIASYPRTEIGDAQVYVKALEAGRVSILRYHEFPHWNPYDCGGYPLWNNPQGFVGAPITWLVYLVGSTRTIEAWVIVHAAIGFVGMWLFARHELRIGRMAAFVAAGAWAFSGFHQHHYSGGHLTFVPFLYVPLALLLWRRAESDARYAVGTGVLAAWMFYEGAVYPLPHLVVLLAGETLTRAWPPKRIPRILLAGAIAGVVAFTIAAARLLPVLDQLRQHRRVMPDDVDALQWATLKDMFLVRAHGRGVPGQQYVWTEFGTYMGPIILALAIVGIFLAGSEGMWMVGLLVFCFVLMLGHQSKIAPWSILHAHVPPFKEMRVPSRFRAEVSAFLAAFAGIAVQRIVDFLRRRFPSPRWSDATRTAIVAIALIGVGDIISVGLTVQEPFFSGAPQAVVVPESPRFYYGGPDMAQLTDLPRQNRGRAFECYDEWGFGEGAAMWEGDTPQAKAIDDAVVVEVANRTQNTFTIDVDVKRPGRILLNTSYDDDWNTDVGTRVKQKNQLAIDLTTLGRYRVKVKFWPRTFNVGAFLTLLGIGGTIAFFVWEKRRRLAGQRDRTHPRIA